MFCPNCGCNLPAVAKFCVRCGSQILSSVEVGRTVGTTDAPGTAAAATQLPDSRRAQFPDSEVPPPYAYAKGNRFVVPRDAVLPPRCVKCGNLPADPWLTKTFSWHSPGLYVLLVSPILFLIVALIVQKKIKLSVPLCATHKSIRKKRLWLSAILLLGCIPIPVALATYVGNDEAAALSVFLGLGMFLAGAAFHGYASPIRPAHIGSGSAEFKGACKDFLANLRPVPPM
jgi:hypothetical protein